MKKLFFFFILFVALTAIACKQPTGSNQPGSESQETVTPGWYLYTTNADSANPQKTYFYINTSGAIERAGSTQYEYTGSQLEKIQGQLSYTICKKNADGTVITFVSCESPTWENGNNEPNNISTCPYAEGEYLDIKKHWESSSSTDNPFYWPVNKNLPLWTEDAMYYETSCNIEYGYISNDNIFIVGSALKAGDEIRITTMVKVDDYNTSSYGCDVIFTAENSTEDENVTEHGTEISLQEGYEWWCFENAYAGPLNCYVLYDINGNPVKAGTNEGKITNSLYLSMTKSQAIQNYNGTKYQITDLTQLPSWCY